MKNFILMIMLIFILKIIILKFLKIDLFFDEAYYWYWSKHLDFGYYSKPPMIALIIKFFTLILGDNIYAIKIGANLLYSLTAIFIYLITYELTNNKKLSFSAGLTYITLPGISYLSMVISTDAPLSFFWAATLYFFIKSIKYNNLKYWILAAIFAGLGLLSKPTMIIFLFALLIYIILFKKELLKNKKLYLALLISGIIYLPNFIWNYYHNFIMFHHIEQISRIDHKLFHPNKLLEFLAGQFLIFGPIFFGIMIFKIKELLKIDKLLFIFSYTFLGIISIQALLERANINWALPTYIGATILITIYLKHSKFLYIGIIINILLSFIIYFYHPIAKLLNIELTRKKDFYSRVLGWQNIANKIKPIIQQYPNTLLLFTDRKTMSEMIFYLNRLDSVLFNPSKKLINQFAINTNLNKHINKNFILIIDNKNIKHISKYFEKCNLIEEKEEKIYKDLIRRYYLFYCKNFRGY